MSNNKNWMYCSSDVNDNYASRIGDLNLRNDIDYQKIVNDFIRNRENYLASGNSDQIHVSRNGTITYYKDRKLHRLDGPAIQHANGYESWFVNGLFQRGYESWFVNGLFQRNTNSSFLLQENRIKVWYSSPKVNNQGPDLEHNNKVWYATQH